MGWAYRTFFGGVAVNVLKPPVPRIYLRLRFRDAHGAIRDFPPNYPIRVRFGDGVGAAFVTPSPPIQPGGLLSFDGRVANPWQFLTLEFSAPEIPYFICEALGSPPASPPAFQLASNLANATRNRERYFSLPKVWELGQADWSPPVFGANGSFSPPRGKVSHTVSPPADIGSAANPIVLVLNPHWKYLQFQYFDRFYGHGLMNSPPGSGHQRRISIPPIVLEGFRNDPSASASPPDTHSNWTLGADPKDLVQSLPWIFRRQVDGSPASPPLRGSTVGIRFRTDPAKISAVYSQDQTTRIIQNLSPPATPPAVGNGPLDPGPNRLRYYDLPRIWKSRNYFARGVPDSPPGSSPPAGQFFSDLNVADLARSDNLATPIIFSLDDIILSDPAGNPLPVAATDRIAVVHHRFADRQVSPPAAAAQFANVNTEGVYQPGGDASPPGYPYSKIALRKPHYVTDYADWTRLIIAQGNLYDVFGNRTPDSAAADRVIGARAGVRWIDATTAPNGVASGVHMAGSPPLTQQTFFSIQPFFQQNYISHSVNPQVAPLNHDEWVTPYGVARYQIGRTDLALFRCCDYVNSEEVAVLLRYMKFNFSFVSPPLSTSPPAVQMGWAKRFLDLITQRWNGPDSVVVGGVPHVLNEQRAWILPSPPNTPLLRAQIITLLQCSSAASAHYQVTPIAPSGRSWMSAWDGTGMLRTNALPHDSTSGFNGLPGRGLAVAHEAGHCGSLQDEYREGESESRDWKSLHILGNPYIHDAFGIMNNNWDVRARYFWYCTEWIRRLNGMGAMNFRIHHGATESNYILPPYPHNAAARARDFVTHPIRFNFRTPAAGSSCFDSLLYALGADAYSTNVLPSKLGPPARIDSILIVLLRTHFDLNQIPGNPTFQGSVRNFLFSRVQLKVESRLNFKFTANFQTHAAGAPQFSRCLLHFTPGVAATFSSPPGSSPPGSTDPAFWTNNVRHLLATLSPPRLPALSPPPSPPWPAMVPPASPPFSPPLSPPVWTDSAPAAPKQVRVDVPSNLNTLDVATRNRFLEAVAESMFQYACSTLGLTAQSPPIAGDYKSPPSYQGIVRTVMDAAAPNPVIS